MLGGVCAGTAAYVGLPAWAVRLIFLISVFAYGISAGLYLTLWWMLPKEGHAPQEGVIWRQRSDGSHTPPFRRTIVDRKIAGVCGGIARYLSMDPSLVRVAVLALTLVSLGATGFLYLLATILIDPNEDNFNIDSNSPR